MKHATLLPFLLPAFLVFWLGASAQTIPWQRQISGYINGVETPAYTGGLSRGNPTLVDINADGDLDLFFGSAYGNIYYFENMGSKTKPLWDLKKENFFSNQFGEITSISFCDIDGDQDLDVFVGDFYANMHFYRNEGNMTEWDLQYVQNIKDTIGLVGRYSSFAFGDLDNDGDLDLIVGLYSGEVLLFMNSGNIQAFDFSKVPIQIDSFAAGFAKPTLVDIDGDEDLDLYISTTSNKIHGSPILWLIENLGTKSTLSFAAISQPILVNSDSFNLLDETAFAFGDLDGDQDYDLIGYGQENGLNYFENQGSPAAPDWKLTDNFYLCIDMGYGTAIEPVDIDGDDDIDIIGGSYNIIFPGPTGMFTLENIGNKQEPDWSLVPNIMDLGIQNAGYPAFADIDHDDDLDFFWGQISPGRIIHYQNTGNIINPAWEMVTDQYASIDVGSFCQPVFVDIDSDGDLDLFVSHNDKKVYFFNNSGSAIQAIWDQPDSTLIPTDNLSGIRAALAFNDMDGDGDKDLLLSYSHDFQFKYFENTGTAKAPQFELRNNSYLTEDYYRDMIPRFVDMDDDGDNDLIIGTGEGGILYFENRSYTTDIKETSPIAEDVISLFPNPTNGLLNYEHHSIEPLYLSIQTLAGQEIFRTKLTNYQGTIELSNKIPGVYIVKTWNAKRMGKTGKLIVTK